MNKKAKRLILKKSEISFKSYQVTIFNVNMTSSLMFISKEIIIWWKTAVDASRDIYLITQLLKSDAHVACKLFQLIVKLTT